MEQQRKVLVVEDIEYLRNKYAEIVASVGYQVDKAKSLEEALPLIGSKTYHVAVVDLQLVEDDERNRRQQR